MSSVLLGFTYVEQIFLIAGLAISFCLLQMLSLVVLLDRKYVVACALSLYFFSVLYILNGFDCGLVGELGLQGTSTIFWGWLGLSELFQCLIYLGLFFVFLLLYYQIELLPVGFSNDIVFLILYSALGVVLLVAADDLIMVYLAMELISLTSYVLVAGERSKVISIEAGVKYFVLGSLASLLFLAGVGVLYNLFGTTNFSELFWFFERADNALFGELSVFAISLIFMFAGVFFKVSAVPFHAWTLDVYTGAPYVVLAYIAIVGKLPFFLLAVKFLWQLYLSAFAAGFSWMLPIAIGSMVVGCFGAMYQFNLKRFLAYMTVGHTGYLLLFFSTGLVAAFSGFFIYLIIYYTLLVGFFGVVFSLRRVDFDLRSTFAGLLLIVRSAPVISFSLVVVLFSMGGVPPLAGFYSKFLLLQNLVMVKFYVVAFFVVLVSAVNVFFYLRIVKIVSFEGAGIFLQNYSFVQRAPALLSVAIVLVLAVNLLFNAGFGDGVTLLVMNSFLKLM